LDHKVLEIIDFKFSFVLDYVKSAFHKDVHFKYNHCGVMDSMLTLSVVHLGFEFKYNHLCGVMDSMLTLSVVHLGFEFKYNNLCGVMDSMLTLSVVHHGFELKYNHLCGVAH
jgi:hypothetical protein